MSVKAFVLVLTLAVAFAVVAVRGEEETTTEATEKPGFAEAAKEKWEKGVEAAKEKWGQGVEAAKEGIAKAEEALSNAKDKIGPMASNFSESFKEKWNEGVEKAKGWLQDAKETISTRVSGSS